jgi:hypothetical protein
MVCPVLLPSLLPLHTLTSDYHYHRFTDRIEPWVHYVPVQNDLSDLFDSLVFFRGDPTGTNAHDDMARKIAYAGRAWSKKFWRKEDLTAYMFRSVSPSLFLTEAP